MFINPLQFLLELVEFIFREPEEGCKNFVSSFGCYKLNAQNCTIPPWTGTWKLLAGLVCVVMKESEACAQSPS